MDGTVEDGEKYGDAVSNALPWSIFVIALVCLGPSSAHERSAAFNDIFIHETNLVCAQELSLQDNGGKCSRERDALQSVTWVFLDVLQLP
jgi:hypothetical protein